MISQIELDYLSAAQLAKNGKIMQKIRGVRVPDMFLPTGQIVEMVDFGRYQIGFHKIAKSSLF